MSVVDVVIVRNAIRGRIVAMTTNTNIVTMVTVVDFVRRYAYVIPLKAIQADILITHAVTPRAVVISVR